MAKSDSCRSMSQRWLAYSVLQNGFLLLLSGLVSRLLLLTSFLALAVARSLLLLTTDLDGDAVVDGFLLVCNGSGAREDVRVALLQLGQNLQTMLRLGEATREHFNRLENLCLESLVGHDSDCFLKDIVAELVSHEALNDEADSDLACARLVSKLASNDLIIPVVGALEDLVDLDSSLRGLKALLNNV